jgi:hypothetical protein
MCSTFLISCTTNYAIWCISQILKGITHSNLEIIFGTDYWLKAREINIQKDQ